MTLQNQIYNTLPVGVFIFDIETQTIQEWGPHTTIILGYGRSVMLGKPLAFLVKDPSELLVAARKLEVRKSSEIDPVDVRIYEPSGRTKGYYLNVFPVVVAGKKYIGCSVIAQTETDRLLLSLRGELAALKAAPKQPRWNERRADSELRMWEVRSQERIAITMIRFVFGTMAILTILSTISFVSSQIINSTYDLLIYFAGVISGVLGAKQLYQNNGAQMAEKRGEEAAAQESAEMYKDPYSRERAKVATPRDRAVAAVPVDREKGGGYGELY